jgi:hypothetical protein
VSATRAHLSPDELFDIRGTLLIDEEADVPLCGKANHDAKPVPLRGVEERPGRRGKDSDGVDSMRSHVSEISFYYLDVGKLVAARSRRKRSIRDAAHVKLLVADEQELAVNTRPSIRPNSLHHSIPAARVGSDRPGKVRRLPRL